MARFEADALKGELPSEYAGYCRRCSTIHRLHNDVPLALDALRALFRQLVHEKAEHDALLASKGKMVGVLVTRRPDGSQLVLRAFSGELEGRREWPGWVPPVLRRKDTAELERQTLARIAECDRQIAACDVDGAQRRVNEAASPEQLEAAKVHLLRAKSRVHGLQLARRDVSRVLSTAFFDAAAVTNARGERRPLREIFVGDRIAGGTTECSIPKLLEAANVSGLRPIALGEAWWGPTIGTRHHGDVQNPCERKCQPILGHLLCGLE